MPSMTSPVGFARKPNDPISDPRRDIARPSASSQGARYQARCFPSTLWRVVLTAGDASSPENRQCLESLCRNYWFPLYAYIRGRGYKVEDARDLTQAFFNHVLEKNSLAHVASEKGRFRTFLLCCLNHYLTNERNRARTLKRGGRMIFVALDGVDPEERYRLEPVDRSTPDQLFDRNWARETMARALARLRKEFDGGGKSRRFDVLKGFLAGHGGFASYAEAARELGVKEQAVKAAVPRLRRRLGGLLRKEIAGTLSDETLVEEELRHLLAALAE